MLKIEILRDSIAQFQKLNVAMHNFHKGIGSGTLNHFNADDALESINSIVWQETQLLEAVDRQFAYYIGEFLFLKEYNEDFIVIKPSRMLAQLLELFGVKPTGWVFNIQKGVK